MLLCVITDAYLRKGFYDSTVYTKERGKRKQYVLFVLSGLFLFIVFLRGNGVLRDL